MIAKLRYFRRWFIAFFHLDGRIVCEMSVGRGDYDDFHDYTDSQSKYPGHLIAMSCRRCGKTFMI